MLMTMQLVAKIMRAKLHVLSLRLAVTDQCARSVEKIASTLECDAFICPYFDNARVDYEF